MNRDRGIGIEVQQQEHGDWDRYSKGMTVKGTETQTVTDGHRRKDRDCDRQADRNRKQGQSDMNRWIGTEGPRQKDKDRNRERGKWTGTGMETKTGKTNYKRNRDMGGLGQREDE